MRYPVTVLLLAIALPILGGCGQMGPLYMPERDPQAAGTETESETGKQADTSEQLSSAP